MAEARIQEPQKQEPTFLPDESPADGHPVRHGSLLPGIIGAIGVVFGDIGTSPLYALPAAIGVVGKPSMPAETITGIVSLIVWALTIVVSIKYVAIVMAADNEGEGGILALVSLVVGPAKTKQRIPFLLLFGILGAALLYGDGAITPAISVLSAVEGLTQVDPGLGQWVVPLTLALLVLLFAVQGSGTGRLAALFGPVMTCWFAAIAALGIAGILRAPAILAALNPLAAVHLMTQAPALAFAVFGAAFLALTGAEALYADMGHFGARPIRYAWYFWAWPALILNYLGQGAAVLVDPKAAGGLFFHLVPAPLLLPMVGLATLATVIASQALISGVFSLTRQAIAMHLLPRMNILPTSSKAYGQIYVGVVNWGLMAATLLLVVAFRKSDNLANAYGIAVSGTMLFTTVLLFKVLHERWRLPLAATALVVTLFGLIDLGFLAANLRKFAEGGWLPLAMGAGVAFLMVTWRIGIAAVQQRLYQNAMPMTEFLELMDQTLVARIPGCGVFVTRQSERASPMLLHHLRHNRVLHEYVILLSVEPTRRPRIPAAERLEIGEIGKGVYRLSLRIGFMEKPDLPRALKACARLGWFFCKDDVHYYVAHEALVRHDGRRRVPRWVWSPFHLMHRLAVRAADFFHLPAPRVMEVGFRVEI